VRAELLMETLPQDLKLSRQRSACQVIRFVPQQLVDELIQPLQEGLLHDSGYGHGFRPNNRVLLRQF
jgi:hypothetical protein